MTTVELVDIVIDTIAEDGGIVNKPPQELLDALMSGNEDLTIRFLQIFEKGVRLKIIQDIRAKISEFKASEKNWKKSDGKI